MVDDISPEEVEIAVKETRLLLVEALPSVLCFFEGEPAKYVCLDSNSLWHLDALGFIL